MLDILYLDDYLAIVNKPAGWLVHRTPLDRGETRFVLQTLRDQIGQHVWPVHRLDKGTSGVLLFALDADTARLLGGVAALAEFARDEDGRVVELDGVADTVDAGADDDVADVGELDVVLRRVVDAHDGDT
jgi:hypothetical protein